MSRAVCVPFHRYHPHADEHYKIYWELFKKSLEYFRDDIDHLYLIDSYWGFTGDDIKDLGVPTTIIPKEKDGHHWVQFKTALPYLKEDYVLFLDNDVVIYDNEVVGSWFLRAKDYDLVTAFDGSGGLEEAVGDSSISQSLWAGPDIAEPCAIASRLVPSSVAGSQRRSAGRLAARIRRGIGPGRGGASDGQEVGSLPREQR